MSHSLPVNAPFEYRIRDPYTIACPLAVPFAARVDSSNSSLQYETSSRSMQGMRC
eukprot:m.31826 g.31826  ORF g.31826 m.31826 type:complete len:55 (+) comp14045_c0_seq1:835-999(+)